MSIFLPKKVPVIFLFANNSEKEILGEFRRVSENLREFGRGRVWGSFREFGRTWENLGEFGGFGRVWEAFGDVRRVWGI